MVAPRIAAGLGAPAKSVLVRAKLPTGGAKLGAPVGRALGSARSAVPREAARFRGVASKPALPKEAANLRGVTSRAAGARQAAKARLPIAPAKSVLVRGKGASAPGAQRVANELKTMRGKARQAAAAGKTGIAGPASKLRDGVDKHAGAVKAASGNAKALARARSAPAKSVLVKAGAPKLQAAKLGAAKVGSIAAKGRPAAAQAARLSRMLRSLR